MAFIRQRRICLGICEGGGMTNKEAMTDEELTRMMTCRQCVYDKHVNDKDPWHCVRYGWNCKDGRTRWLEQECKQ